MDTFDTQIGNVYNVSRAIAEQWKYIKEHAKQGVSVVNMEVVDKVLTADNFTFAFKTLYSDGSSTTTPAVVIPVFKGEKGDQGEQGLQGEQGEQGVSVTDVEVIPQTSDNQGILYHIETTLSNGTKINSGDFLVPKGDKGDKGDKGVGIEEIENGTPTVNGEYTHTPITVRYTDQSTQNFEIAAKNGENGSSGTPDMINLDNDPATSIDINTLTNNNTYSFTMANRLTNLPDNTVTHGMLQVFQGEEYLNTSNNMKFRQLRQTLYADKDNNLATAYRDGYIITDTGGSQEFEVGSTYWYDWKKQQGEKKYQHFIHLAHSSISSYLVAIEIINNRSTPYNDMNELLTDISKGVSKVPWDLQDITFPCSGYTGANKPVVKCALYLNYSPCALSIMDAGFAQTLLSTTSGRLKNDYVLEL